MAMLTVVFLALLLSIMTISFVRLSVREQRQATDDSLTNRAFYAAESGLEDAKRALQRNFDSDPLNNVALNADICRPAEVVPIVNDTVELSLELDTYYTCQLIDMSPPDFQAELDEWGSVTLPLRAASGGFDRVVIRWHQQGPPPFNGDYGLAGAGGTTNLPPYPDWRGGAAECASPTGLGCPAMLRTQVFHTTATAPLNRDDFASSAGVLRPTSAPGTGATYSSLDKEVTNINCAAFNTIPDGEYACTATITGLNVPDRLYYLHLSSLYRSTNVHVSLFNSAVQVDMQDAQAVVDVTGRAGDVYRRIQARVGLSQEYPLPDVAVWGNEEICKDFTVAVDPDDYLNTCAWNSTP